VHRLLEEAEVGGAGLAAEHPEIVQDLSATYDQWAKRCDVVPWSEITAKRPKNPPAKE